MSAIPDFYDTSRLEQIAINLFHGWGYNFYRLENQLRADDQMIRAKTSWLLGLGRRSVESAEAAYRRERLPPPSRDAPRPDPASIAGAQMLERLSRAIGAADGQIRAQPVPENDRMRQRYRREAETLSRLATHDRTLVGQADLLRQTLEGRDGTWMIDNGSALSGGVEAIVRTLAERQATLVG